MLAGPMLRWSLSSLTELDSSSLYDVFTLRERVFIVEQNCAYLDCDGRDRVALHLLGRMPEGALVAYARLLPPGVRFEEASIGRVVTAPEVRRMGFGRPLMHEAIARARAAFGGALRISAQRYVERFYAELGFVACSEPYDEDGIAHIDMLLPSA